MGLLVIRNQHQKPKYLCTIPTKTGPCGAIFCEGEETARDAHAKLCAGRHQQEIHDSSIRNRLPMMHPDFWDPEYAAHLRNVGRRMIATNDFDYRKGER